ncbi:MAG: tRNA (guanosine(46)-N7)-methyltransferase TrmB [Pseudolabrys sp.]|nr:tRNA (guanosine(46)-N7)-methyltransferase TrmB [Pseudolabrys sp.]
MSGIWPGMTKMNDKPDIEPRAFFGRRKGHPLRPRHAALYDMLLPQLALDLSRPAPADLLALFPVQVSEVRLEIGFGGGEHLIKQAQSEPHTGFIGVEPFVNGTAKALAAIDANKLRNIRLWPADVLPLLQWLPAASLSRLYLLYPDPWPKRRHWKRRFVQDETVSAIARILRPGGEWRYATDIASYAAWTLARVMRSSAFEWTATSADDWRQPWPEFSSTRYEAKALREGRTGNYFTFRRN